MKVLLDTAIRASLKAGSRIMEIYESEDFEVVKKGDDSPLTKADLAAHEVIKSYLEITGIPVLSEEGKEIPFKRRKNWSPLWMVDPLDGTKEFIKRNGEFTVNIALIEKGKPVLGVIYVPVSETLYYAEKDLGAYKAVKSSKSMSLIEILETAERLPLNVAKQNFTLVASKSHLSHETQNYITELQQQHETVKIISKGSSLKLCMVAEGSADCYPRFGPTMEWDTAAGHAICSFAGKSVTDYITGEEMVYNKENLLNNYFLAV